jgi:hypothetical protein
VFGEIYDVGKAYIELMSESEFEVVEWVYINTTPFPEGLRLAPGACGSSIKITRGVELLLGAVVLVLEVVVLLGYVKLGLEAVELVLKSVVLVLGGVNGI